MMNFSKKPSVMVVLTILGIFSLGACDMTSSSQATQQGITEQYAPKLSNAEPYPLSQMNDSSERANLRERLLRMNNPNKIGYVYLFTNMGQLLSYYTIKGKVSSTGSQLSNTQNVNHEYSAPTVTDAMGDDGSYGPEECSTSGGIFFFTTAGVLEETCIQNWVYSDAPLDLKAPPLVVLNANAQPSSTAGQLK